MYVYYMLHANSQKRVLFESAKTKGTVVIMNRTANKAASGSVKIAEDVISALAIVAAAEVDGVKYLNDQKPKKLSKKAKKHIKLSYNGNKLVVDVYIIVKYGYIIPRVASKVQTNVLEAVESMSGINVEAVNVHCTGISFNKDDAKSIK